MEKHSGFFTFYWDERAGKIGLEIDEFEKDPKSFKLPPVLAPPPGAPIGTIENGLFFPSGPNQRDFAR